MRHKAQAGQQWTDTDEAGVIQPSDIVDIEHEEECPAVLSVGSYCQMGGVNAVPPGVDVLATGANLKYALTGSGLSALFVPAGQVWRLMSGVQTSSVNSVHLYCRVS